MTVNEITACIRKILKPSRFEHSVSVANTAKHLAKLYGADSEKAYVAGVLHDCAKCYTDEELKRKVKEYGINPDSISTLNPKLLHSYVGAYEAKNLYGIDDEEIIDAIYYHTIGKEDMSLLCKIIYLADAIEPLRNYPSVDKIRQLAESSLDAAVLEYTERSILFLVEKGEYIHPNAIETRNYYLNKNS